MTSVGPGLVHPLHVQPLHGGLVDQDDATARPAGGPAARRARSASRPTSSCSSTRALGLVVDLDAHRAPALDRDGASRGRSGRCAAGRPRAGRPAASARRRSGRRRRRWRSTSRCRTTSWLVSSAKWTSSRPSRMSLHDPQAGLGAAGQVDLGDVAGDDHLRAEAEPGEEHLHLLRRGVLRLVEDDERVVERAAAHVGQRRDLDGAGRHQPRDRLRVDHVVQRVVERPQVGVDLVGQRAGQEAEPLARLDRRAGSG